MFKTIIDLLPFPIDADQALLQSRAVQALIDAADIAAVKQKAMSDILGADNSVDRSETERLRALYRFAYTPAELGVLIDRTFAQLRLGE
ncbi:MAG: hypothetical protein AAFR51_16720 [Pseudomonadota bacterium]